MSFFNGYFVNPAKQSRSLKKIEKILDSAQSLANEKTDKSVEVREIIDHSHSSMGAIYHHFPSVGGIFASLMIRRIASKQSIVINTIQSMAPNTGVNKFSEALINLAFQDWAHGNKKVRNTAIRFFYRNAKEPELFLCYANALIPHLHSFLCRNTSNEFRVVDLDEWPLLLRAMQTALTSPFIEQLSIAGSDRHRDLITYIWDRLLSCPSGIRDTANE